MLLCFIPAAYGKGSNGWTAVLSKRFVENQIPGLKVAFKCMIIKTNGKI